MRSIAAAVAALYTQVMFLPFELLTQTHTTNSSRLADCSHHSCHSNAYLNEWHQSELQMCACSRKRAIVRVTVSSLPVADHKAVRSVSQSVANQCGGQVRGDLPSC